MRTWVFINQNVANDHPFLLFQKTKYMLTVGGIEFILFFLWIESHSAEISRKYLNKNFALLQVSILIDHTHQNSAIWYENSSFFL
jgi:hypothetical protein